MDSLQCFSKVLGPIKLDHEYTVAFLISNIIMLLKKKKKQINGKALLNRAPWCCKFLECCYKVLKY